MASRLMPLELDDPHYGHIRTSVLLDPTPRQIARFAGNVPNGQLRGTACDGRLVVFPAWDVTHIQIRRAFGLPDILYAGTDFWIVPENDDPLSPDWQSSDDDLVRDGLRLVAGARTDDPSFLSVRDWFAAEVPCRPAAMG